MNGDTFYTMVGGGAGYGDPLERDPESVIQDLRNNRMSHWAAQEIYKVVYDQESLRPDLDATEELRNQTREDRKRGAKSYDEFEAEWSKQRPSEEALKYFGTFPHPSEGINAGPPGM